MTKEEKIELIKDAAFFGGTIPSSKYEEMREFFDKLEAHVKAGVTSEGDRYLLEVITPSGNSIDQRIITDENLAAFEFNALRKEYPKNWVNKITIPTPTIRG